MKNRYTIKKIVKDCLFPEGLYEIKDKETKFYLIMEDKKDVEKLKDYLITKDEQIRSLEEQLKKAKPKYELGQKVYGLYRDTINPFEVDEIQLRTNGFWFNDYSRGIVYKENLVFATREEAEKRLDELEGE